MCRDEVMMEAEKMSGAPPGSRAFLGCLQDATTKLWNSRSDEEQQMYVRLSNKWSEEAPPPDIQARYERICAYAFQYFFYISALIEWPAPSEQRSLEISNLNYSQLAESRLLC
jgi:hypothetical protein